MPSRWWHWVTLVFSSVFPITTDSCSHHTLCCQCYTLKNAAVYVSLFHLLLRDSNPSCFTAMSRGNTLEPVVLFHVMGEGCITQPVQYSVWCNLLCRWANTMVWEYWMTSQGEVNWKCVQPTTVTAVQIYSHKLLFWLKEDEVMYAVVCNT